MNMPRAHERAFCAPSIFSAQCKSDIRLRVCGLRPGLNAKVNPFWEILPPRNTVCSS